jgi:hypothetical protein
MTLRPRMRLHWHRRGLRKRDGDQLLNDVGRMSDVDSETAEQHRGQAQLNQNDRGERKNALPRPNRSS